MVLSFEVKCVVTVTDYFKEQFCYLSTEITCSDQLILFQYIILISLHIFGKSLFLSEDCELTCCKKYFHGQR